VRKLSRASLMPLLLAGSALTAMSVTAQETAPTEPFVLAYPTLYKDTANPIGRITLADAFYGTDIDGSDSEGYWEIPFEFADHCTGYMVPTTPPPLDWGVVATDMMLDTGLLSRPAAGIWLAATGSPFSPQHGLMGTGAFADLFVNVNMNQELGDIGDSYLMAAAINKFGDAKYYDLNPPHLFNGSPTAELGVVYHIPSPCYMKAMVQMGGNNGGGLNSNAVSGQLWDLYNQMP
jgi:hypothetical protein